MDEDLTDAEATVLMRQDLEAWQAEVVRLESQLARAKGRVAALECALEVHA